MPRRRKPSGPTGPIDPGISQSQIKAVEDFLSYDPVHRSLMERVTPLTTEEVAEYLGVSPKSVPYIEGLPVLEPSKKTPGATHARGRLYPASGVAYYRVGRLKFQSGEGPDVYGLACAHAWPAIARSAEGEPALAPGADMRHVPIPIYIVCSSLGIRGPAARRARDLIATGLPIEHGYIVAGAYVDYLADTIKLQLGGGVSA